eukprot:2665606-Rhodomonas_salina.2
MARGLNTWVLLGLAIVQLCSSLPVQQSSVSWGIKPEPRSSQNVLRPKGGGGGKDAAEPLVAVKITFDLLWRGAIAGSIAGTVLEGALYPIDTLKTRVQTGYGNEDLNICSLCSGQSPQENTLHPSQSLHF